jgi:hypothetical protein
MEKLLKPPLIGLILLTLVLGLGFALEAVAVVGAPCTPVSVAGVARRTTRRVVVASTATPAPATTTAAATTTAPPPAQPAAAAPAPAPPPAQPPAAAPATAGAPPVGSIVTALPPGCVSAPKGGVEYYNCGGVYYRPTFQGNNLVYVVQQP